jgi:pSer/pThr/pTyr-binding forkhead associated (FHA) protein
MDLNSTNGTFVNAQRVKDQVVVHHDIIEIGAHRIRFIASNVQ